MSPQDTDTCKGLALTGTGRRFSAGLDLDGHYRLFAGDPAAVGSWFADYRATNMRLFTCTRDPEPATPWARSATPRATGRRCLSQQATSAAGVDTRGR